MRRVGFFLFAALARAAAADPGVVAGSVRLAGARPPLGPAVPVGIDAPACGTSVPDEPLVLSPDGGVQGAVGVVRGAPR
ncbi:MAG TPA: hypothetical protein VFD84_14225 [Candidatus Binatia bacterium]|nr:hypothetical protein [Candidatus Binatia bacterium]